MKEAEVFETASGLAVVTQDVESVRASLRSQRRAENRLKRSKAVQRHTGGSQGKATWKAKAKAKHKLDRS